MAGLYESSSISSAPGQASARRSSAPLRRSVMPTAQVRALFDRNVLQFPPPGFDAEDSFFAVRDDDGPDRLYVGIPTAGRSPKFALQALIAALLQSAAALRERGAASDDESIPTGPASPTSTVCANSVVPTC